MTWPDHLLTLHEWEVLPEDNERRIELVEGVPHVAPAPTTRHQRAILRLADQLNASLATVGLEAVQDVDVVLVESYPPTVRRPDLVVTTTALLDREPNRLSAGDVQLVVEIISPGSARIDRIMKLADYSDAGIENYWIVDLDTAATIDVFGLAEGRYEPILEDASGTVAIDRPTRMTIDLRSLVP